MSPTFAQIVHAEAPTKGRFRQRIRNEIYFTGSGTHERGGMYAFWVAATPDKKRWSRLPHFVTVVPGRSRLGLPKNERFERMKRDAVNKPHHRKIYRDLYQSLEKPLRVRPAMQHEIEWWLDAHPVEASYARSMKYRKRGFYIQ